MPFYGQDPVLAWCCGPWSSLPDRLVGLVVRRPPRERKIPDPRPPGMTLCSSDLKTDTVIATALNVWRYGVSGDTGQPGGSTL